MEQIAFYESPLGRILLVTDGEALTRLQFDDQAHLPREIFSLPRCGDLPAVRAAKTWLDRYFSGQELGPAPLLRPRGTAFQTEVWSRLLQIPFGGTVSYGDLARDISAGREGPGTSARAVGAAVGRNPVAILIPCHRVLGADGSLTGYAGGLWRKAALLRLEGSLAADGPAVFHS